MATMSHADRGAATAEFAVVLPAVAMVAMVLLCLTRTVTVSMRCQDAASAVVRELVTREGGLVGSGDVRQRRGEWHRGRRRSGVGR